MINVLIPAMGNSEFFKDSYFPKILTEISGETMLERVVEDYRDLESVNFIFVFHEEDCRRFHMDDSVRILAPSSHVIKLSNQTAGALCTCLMAIDLIDKEEPLIIANCDQIIDVAYGEVISSFDEGGYDAGVITFPSVHPRWSYALVRDCAVVEIAEKRPISRHAIAGFYYYAKGADYIDAARRALLKQNSLDGRYYISATMNEMILQGSKIGYYEIGKEQYNSFYSPAKIKEYEDKEK